MVAVVEMTNGKLCLHPVSDGKKTFLPCAYGYATIIRKAQDASLDALVFFFFRPLLRESLQKFGGCVFLGGGGLFGSICLLAVLTMQMCATRRRRA